MPTNRLTDMNLSEIMNRWPPTIRVFIDRRMHRVGCPDVAAWWLGFLVATIAAERLELSRIIRPGRLSQAGCRPRWRLRSPV